MSTNNRFKHKVKLLLSSCRQEIEKTTVLGKKMLTASRTNAELHETYEELGVLTHKMLKEGHPDWQMPKMRDLCKRIDMLEEELKYIEEEVQKIKMASGPEDISRKDQNSKQ